MLPLSARRFSNILRKLIGKQYINYSDFAPWINTQIKEFEKLNDIELHVIAPHSGLKYFKHEFQMNGIYYHFFRHDWPLQFDAILSKLIKKKTRRFRLSRLRVNQFIKKIKPDIVNLIGSENPYYSMTVLDIKHLPIYVSAQTVYSNPARKNFVDGFDQFSWDTELKIHRKERYFGCSGRMHRDLILNNNPNAIIFKYFFPIQKPTNIVEKPKEYDFVFFAANIIQKKGIEDAIEALSLVKKEKSNITLNVLGFCAPDYKNVLEEKILALGLSENVIFNDYLPLHEDVLQQVKKSRFALLPNKLDVISGTIIESILLDLPVVTYKTTGSPFLNKNGEAILLAEIGNIKTLASNMLKLLDIPELASKLKNNAKAFVEKEFDNTTSAKRLVNNYRSVINHFHNNIPIPEDELFDINEFPIY